MVPKHRPITPVLMTVLLRNFHYYFASANEGLLFILWRHFFLRDSTVTVYLFFFHDYICQCSKTQRHWQPFSNYVFCSSQICITHMHECFNYLEICIKAYLKSIYKDCIPTFFFFLLDIPFRISINFIKWIYNR